MEKSSPRISRHALLMLLCCLIPLAVLAAVTVFKVPISQTLTFGLILLCPLSHVAMMALMGHEGGHQHADPSGGIPAQKTGENPSSGKGEAACH